MEARLRPVNAILGLLTRGDVNPASLADAGYRLAGLEVPVVGPDGRVDADIVLFHDDAAQIVLMEAKSGANIDEGQAGRYAGLSAAAVIQATGVSVPRRADIAVEVAYVCLDEHADRIRRGLRAVGLMCATIHVSERRIALTRPNGAATSPLDAAWADGAIDLPGPVSAILPFDHESPAAAFYDAIRAELVAGLSHRRPEVTVRLLTEQVVPHFAIFSGPTQGLYLRKVREVVRRIVAENPDHYAYVPPTQNRRDDVVAFVKTPEDLDTRGRTQAYQALQGRRGAPRARTEDCQTDLLDLLAETVADGSSTDIDVDVEGGDPDADES